MLLALHLNGLLSMTTLDGQAIMTRLREVLEDARGTLRTIPATLYTGKLPPGLDVNEEARRAIPSLVAGTLVPTEARITRVARSAASPPVIGNLALYDLAIEVRQVFPVSSREKLDDDYRDTFMGIAAASADIIAQALMYPGNLTTTQSGSATGIVSGMLSFVDSSYSWLGTVNGAGMTLQVIHKFKGIARSAPATS